MIAAERVAVILLAAGLSRRFGEADKLRQPLGGLPLGGHAARTLAALPFAARIIVTREDEPDAAGCGFTPVVNRDPAAGQSGSLRLGLQAARAVAPAAVLVALADMPFVTIPHLAALMDRFSAGCPIVASTTGTQASPPALFGAGMFDRLAAVDGDSGARALIASATLVRASPAELRDIDTPADLAAAAG